MEDKIRPSHYGGKNNKFEVIKIIDHFNLGFNLGNVIKYVLRAGKKGAAGTGTQGHKSQLEWTIEDLQKAKQYIEFEIAKLKKS